MRLSLGSIFIFSVLRTQKLCQCPLCKNPTEFHVGRGATVAPRGHFHKKAFACHRHESKGIALKLNTPFPYYSHKKGNRKQNV